MKRVMAERTWSESDETLIRRWQAKWKTSGESMLAKARDRLAARRPSPSQHEARALSASARPFGYIDQMRAFNNHVNTMIEFQNAHRSQFLTIYEAANQASRSQTAISNAVFQATNFRREALAFAYAAEESRMRSISSALQLAREVHRQTEEARRLARFYSGR
jgi:hypothetical protein